MPSRCQERRAHFGGRLLYVHLNQTEAEERASRLRALGWPEGFDLPDLPEGATLRRRLQGKVDVALLFARSERELHPRLARVGELVDFKVCRLPLELSATRLSRRRSQEEAIGGKPASGVS